MRLELATSGVASKPSPKRMPKKPQGMALSKMLANAGAIL